MDTTRPRLSALNRGAPILPSLMVPVVAVSLIATTLRCYCGVLGLARSLIFGRFLSNREAGFAAEPHGIVEVSGSIPLGSTRSRPPPQRCAGVFVAEVTNGFARRSSARKRVHVFDRSTQDAMSAGKNDIHLRIVVGPRQQNDLLAPVAAVRRGEFATRQWQRTARTAWSELSPRNGAC